MYESINLGHCEIRLFISCDNEVHDITEMLRTAYKMVEQLKEEFKRYEL